MTLATGRSYSLGMILPGIATRRSASAVFTALFMAVVWAALFPALAPAMDHHAVERHPQHGHLFPGGVAVEHDHGHETQHGHAAGMPVSADGVVIVPATNDITGASVFNLVSLGEAATLALLAPALFILVRTPWRDTLSRFTPGIDTPPPRPAL